MVGRYFEDYYKSVVVLANPKTILNAKFAKKEIKEKVIRADQFVKYIKDMYNQSKESTGSDERLLEFAQSFLDLHKEVKKDYTEKYKKYIIDNNITEIDDEIVTTVSATIPIYNDNQLKDLITKMPRNNEDLKAVAGFGVAKTNKYGEDILKIMSKY